MPIQTNYLFIVTMDVDPDKEDLFNEVYDQEHVPNLLRVPGVVSAVRLKNEPFTVSMGGELRSVSADKAPRYIAIYEIEDPSVLASEAWAAAVEDGRWPDQVRPHTRNRQQQLRRVIGQS